MQHPQLPPGYEFREMSGPDFQPLWQEASQKIFRERTSMFPAFERVSAAEQARWKELGQNMGSPWSLRLAVFHGQEFVAWHTGNQESGEKFYMRNSAVLAEHRRRGIYQALLAEVVKRVSAQGFQVIYSRHTLTNNAVIIPKLKAGFTISSLELCDRFGTLVHLSYYTNTLRRKVLDYRCGERRPDDELRRELGL